MSVDLEAIRRALQDLELRVQVLNDETIEDPLTAGRYALTTADALLDLTIKVRNELAKELSERARFPMRVAEIEGTPERPVPNW